MILIDLILEMSKATSDSPAGYNESEYLDPYNDIFSS